MLMSASEEAHLIRPDQDDTPVVVKDEGATFVRSAPESLPHLTVPDLAPDAVGISAEALAQVPTLTEQVGDPLPEVPEPDLLQPETDPEPEISAPEVQQQEPVLDTDIPEIVLELAQGLPSHVESWLQQCQSRINQLTDEIHKLNDRLDQLEHRPKA
jgi:hypothetical protein